MNEFQSLADLLDLQAVDLQIDRLLHQRESLPELEQYRAAHNRGDAIYGDLTDVQGELRQISLDEDKAEGELELLEQKVHQHEQRLYAGGMSARETENLRLEVESLRSRRGTLEDQALELLDRKEVLEVRVSQVSDQLAEVRAEESSLEARIAGEWKKIDADIAKQEARKADIIPLIPPELLELYDQLRENKEGVAVGRLEDGGICGGCHLRLSTAERNQVLGDDPPRCLHCRRILVP